MRTGYAHVEKTVGDVFKSSSQACTAYREMEGLARENVD